VAPESVDEGLFVNAATLIRPLIATTLLSVLSANSAWADSPVRPASYAIPVGENGALRFVMLVDTCIRTKVTFGGGAEADGLAEAVSADPRLADSRFPLCRDDTLKHRGGGMRIRRPDPVPVFEWRQYGKQAKWQGRVGEDENLNSYPFSGLYQVDDPREPLWTIDWYAHSVELTEDGRFLVRRGPWGGPLGVAFYDRGKLMSTYDVSDLVSDMKKLVYTVSHYFWVDEWKFLPHAGRLHLRTLAGDQHVFDVTTGALVSTHLWQPPRIAASVALRSGARVDLAAVRLCAHDSPMRFVLGGRGADAAWTIVAMRNEANLGSGAATIEMVKVNLEDVTRLGNEGERTVTGSGILGANWFRLQARDGTVMRIALPGEAALCGTDAAGGATQHRFTEMHSVRLCTGSGCLSP
jgi:hypothetical protein